MGSLVKKGIVKGKTGRIKIKDRGNIAPILLLFGKNTKLNIIIIRDGGKEKQKQDTVERTPKAPLIRLCEYMKTPCILPPRKGWSMVVMMIMISLDKRRYV